MAMQGLLIALACLTCASSGRRLQTPLRKAGVDDTPDPSKVFASLLEVLSPAAAFNLSPASALGQSPAANRAFSNRAISPSMQYNGGWSWNKKPAWKTPTIAQEPPVTVAETNVEATAPDTTVSEKVEALESVESKDTLAPKTTPAAEKAPAASKAPASEKPKETPAGPFAPAVLAAKRVMGEQELIEFRANVIRQHTKVISDFVDTSDSKFGQLVLTQMFKAADKDNNGTLDNQEIREALDKLGFTFMKDKEVSRLIKKADADKNEVIDIDEFIKETPKMLRVNLVKLAKSNGHDLGFLA